MTPEQQAAVYKEFSPDPPSADRLDRVYVELDDVRGGSSVARQLGRAIELSADERLCQLLAGHRGCGKTTELRRLAASLEEGSRHTVVFVSAEKRMDLNDIDFPDLLLAIVREIAEQLESRHGISLRPGYLADRLERVQSLLTSRVELETVGLSSGIAEIGLQLKQSPEARRRVREALEPDTSSLIEATNDLIRDVGVKLKKKGLGPLVLIVDDIDKVSMREYRADLPMGEYLLVNRHPQLSAFECHTIYTVPLALAYSGRSGLLANLYGGSLPVIPMVEIATRPPERTDHEPGLGRMREIVRRRLQVVDVEESSVFAQGSVDALVRASGGQPRELMHLVRKAFVGEGFPVNIDNGVRAAEIETRRILRRGLGEAHRRVIEQVSESGDLPRVAENETVIRELLESRVLLQYINADEWYAPNPLL